MPPTVPAASSYAKNKRSRGSIADFLRRLQLKTPAERPGLFFRSPLQRWQYLAAVSQMEDGIAYDFNAVGHAERNASKATPISSMLMPPSRASSTNSTSPMLPASRASINFFGSYPHE